MISTAALLISSLFFFLKLIIFIACSLKDSQNFMQFLSLYISRLLSMFLNDDIVDIEKPGGICSATFVADEFSG